MLLLLFYAVADVCHIWRIFTVQPNMNTLFFQSTVRIEWNISIEGSVVSTTTVLSFIARQHA